MLAPQIICKFFELPISTSQIDNLSAPSCFKTDKTLPKTTPLTFLEQSSSDSTSNPPIDNFQRSSGVVLISTNFSTNFEKFSYNFYSMIKEIEICNLVC